MTGDTAGLVVIGSGPAGMQAALAYREGGGSGVVQVLSADSAHPYDFDPRRPRNSCRPGGTSRIS